MRTDSKARRVPKLRLSPEEKAVLRGAKLRAVDFVSLAPGEIRRATGGAIALARARELCSLARFQELPSVGPAMAEDFVKLGYAEPKDLVGEDPEKMFAKFERIAGRQDPCVADCFHCAVYYAENPGAPEDKPWWHWSEERLARQRKQGRKSR